MQQTAAPRKESCVQLPHPTRLGHKDLRTTQIYIHVLKLNGFAVRSPADRFRQLLPSPSA